MGVALERPYSKDDNGYLLSHSPQQEEPHAPTASHSVKPEGTRDGPSSARSIDRHCTSGGLTDSFFFNAEDPMTYVSQDLNSTNLVDHRRPRQARSRSIIAFARPQK